MTILQFIKEYWVQIIFLSGVIGSSIAFLKNYREATKCSLRNDILSFYLLHKEEKRISLYEKESIMLSYAIYKKLRGNSFVDRIVAEVNTWSVTN